MKKSVKYIYKLKVYRITISELHAKVQDHKSYQGGHQGVTNERKVEKVSGKDLNKYATSSPVVSR